MAAYWFAFQTPIPGEETLLSLSEKGVGVILALSILLLFVVAALALLLWDRWQGRQADKAAKAAAAHAEDNKADTSQILELTKAIAVLANTDSTRAAAHNAALDRQTAALERYAEAQEKQAASMSEQATLFRQFMEAYSEQTGEHERISREVAAQAVETVMAKLSAIEARLRGPIMTKQLDDLIQDMAAIKAMLKEPRAEPVVITKTPPAPALTANDTPKPVGGEA